MFLGLNVTVSEDRDTVFQKVVSLKGKSEVKVFVAQSGLTLQTVGLQRDSQSTAANSLFLIL